VGHCSTPRISSYGMTRKLEPRLWQRHAPWNMRLAENDLCRARW